MKEISINYNNDTYIIKSKYDYDLYEAKLNRDKEIERLKKEVEDRNSINLACYMLRDDNRELYSRLEKLKSIIKEVREYIKNIPDDEFVESEHFTELLEILDKVEENNNVKD